MQTIKQKLLAKISEIGEPPENVSCLYFTSPPVPVIRHSGFECSATELPEVGLITGLVAHGPYWKYTLRPDNRNGARIEAQRRETD